MFFPQRDVSIYLRKQSRQTWLPVLQAKHDLCTCSIILSVKIALWYSTDMFLSGYTATPCVLGVKGIGDVSFNPKRQNNFRLDIIPTYLFINFICPTEPCNTVFTSC